MRIDALLEAREILSGITPLDMNCGKLCGAACCQPPGEGEEETGMLLFPGEASLYGKADREWMRLEPTNLRLRGKRVPLLICGGSCPREKRPLSCRIFPLAPCFGENGMDVRMDVRGAALCPLIDSGVGGLRRVFVEAVKVAFARLAQDPRQVDFLRLIYEQVSSYERFMSAFF